tara:strand:+ start:191 stop:313 length:123 start_codon:yes stop_codon:yes gene_type:complete
MKIIYKNWMNLTFFADKILIFRVDIKDGKKLVIYTAKGLV